MRNSIRVLIADDHPLLRAGLRMAIQSQQDMLLVGEVADGQEAIAAALHLSPDVVVIDITMPVVNGLEATKLILRSLPEARVLALTMHETAPVLRSFLAAGGSGYLLKKSAGTDLLHAIRALAQGGKYLDPQLGSTLLEELMVEGKLENPGTAELSDREMEVLRLLARGYRNQQIADQMKVSVKTVESYRSRIANKLGLKNRPDIVKYALENHLLTEYEFLSKS